MTSSSDRAGERAEREAANAMVGRYREEQLQILLVQVREGFASMDRGELDAFELDHLIHQYKRSAQKLWSFCKPMGHGGRRAAAGTIEWWQDYGEEPTDWWAAGEPHRR